MNYKNLIFSLKFTPKNPSLTTQGLNDQMLLNFCNTCSLYHTINPVMLC